MTESIRHLSVFVTTSKLAVGSFGYVVIVLSVEKLCTDVQALNIPTKAVAIMSFAVLFIF